MFPKAQIKGHRDFSPDLNKDGKITSNEWIKQCPCFDAMVEYKTI
jgi:N-acetylmuramoyl-L-alanine amidase